MRETSGHSSLSAGDDRENCSPIGPAPQGGTIPVGPVIARARALVDCSPSHYDREALRFKVSFLEKITFIKFACFFVEKNIENWKNSIFFCFFF